MCLEVVNVARNDEEQEDDEDNIPHGTKVLKELGMPWDNTDRIVFSDSYFASVSAAEELWKNGPCFIGVIKTETRKFLMTYLSNIEFNNQGYMSGLLTSPVDRTKPVLGDFFEWIVTGGTSFLLGDRWRKGGRTLACDGGNRTLTQTQIPIWLS